MAIVWALPHSPPSERASAPPRYPEPTRADLVTMWPRAGAYVLSVTSDGKTVDYEIPRGVLGHLARSAVDVLSQ